MTAISVTRALTRIKHLASQIEAASSAPFIGVKKGVNSYESNLTQPSVSVTVFEKNITSNLQSVLDLINERTKLKNLVHESNNLTSLKLCDKVMTVAQAVELKNEIEQKRSLRSCLQMQLTHANAKVANENEQLRVEIEKAATAAFGNDGKVSAEQYSDISKPREEKNKRALIDPNNIQKVIEELTAEIQKFDEEIDFALSESNAVTMIEV
jgi:hypothetical protein